MGTAGWIILGAIVVIALFLVVLYNRLVGLRQVVNQAWSDISVQLKQRHDLVPNLVETVKGYAGHERTTLEAVVNARNAAVAANGPQAQAAAENMLTGALRQLFAAVADGALGSGKQDRGLPPVLQQCRSGIQHGHPAVPGRAHRWFVRLYGAGLLRAGGKRARRRAGAAAGFVLRSGAL
jgi:hypothetical protein